MRRASRKLLIALVLFCVIGYLIYRFIHQANFSWARIMGSVREANPYLLLLSILTIYVCYAVRALRWKVFQQNLGPSRFSTIYGVTLAGFSAVHLMGRLGEPVRPLLMARKEKLPVADMFGIYALERLFDFASMAVIAAAGLFLFEPPADSGDKSRTVVAAARIGGVILFVIVAAAIGALGYLRFHGSARLEQRLRGWLAGHGWKRRIAGIILGFVRGVQAIRTWGQLALASFYSAVHWFLVLVIYLWVSESFGGKLGAINLSGAMLLLAVTLAGSAVQLPAVGGGSQAASMIAYTAIFGVESEAAFVAAIVLWLVTFAACSLAGVPLLIHEGLSLGELRRIAAHQKEIVSGEVAGDAGTAPGRGDATE